MLRLSNQYSNRYQPIPKSGTWALCEGNPPARRKRTNRLNNWMALGHGRGNDVNESNEKKWFSFSLPWPLVALSLSPFSFLSSCSCLLLILSILSIFPFPLLAPSLFPLPFLVFPHFPPPSPPFPISFLTYLLTELFNCELPLDYSTTWLSYWLLYLLTELFNCELFLGYSTSWLSYSIVSYLLATLRHDWAIQLWATSWLLYLLTLD